MTLYRLRTFVVGAEERKICKRTWFCRGFACSRR
jgi:hypothetical protein